MAWSQEQLRNASTIVSVGRRMGLSTRDIQIGLITAMVESNLVNVNHGDRDSLGLFQQRPSQGWGTPAQVTNPQYAAGKFFSALSNLGNRRFEMGMGEAAQAVQRSAFPERYAQRLPDVRRMWPTVARAAGDNPMDMDGNLMGFTPLADVAKDLTADTAAALAEEQGAVVEAPDASTMLGAWGMAAPQPEAPIDPDLLSAMPLVSEGTNGSVLQGIMDATQDFGPGVDGWRRGVIEAAMTAVGTPYTWGGNSLQGGVDCSGLIQQAFARAGLDMPRVSFQQASVGRRVGLKNLRPGDLVAWDNSSRNNGADHIALYIGDGRIIEAARPGTAVRVRHLGNDEGAWGVSLNF